MDGRSHVCPERERERKSKRTRAFAIDALERLSRKRCVVLAADASSQIVSRSKLIRAKGDGLCGETSSETQKAKDARPCARFQRDPASDNMASVFHVRKPSVRACRNLLLFSPPPPRRCRCPPPSPTPPPPPPPLSLISDPFFLFHSPSTLDFVRVFTLFPLL